MLAKQATADSFVENPLSDVIHFIFCFTTTRAYIAPAICDCFACHTILIILWRSCYFHKTSVSKLEQLASLSVEAIDLRIPALDIPAEFFHEALPTQEAIDVSSEHLHIHGKHLFALNTLGFFPCVHAAVRTISVKILTGYIILQARILCKFSNHFVCRLAADYPTGPRLCQIFVDRAIHNQPFILLYKISAQNLTPPRVHLGIPVLIEHPCVFRIVRTRNAAANTVISITVLWIYLYISQ